MLNKLTTTPTLLRLSLSLLASAGIHGGVAYYDWESQSASVHDGRKAVVVALVSAADDPAFAVDARKTDPQQNTEAADLQAMAENPSAPSTTPAVKPLPAKPSKPKVAKGMTGSVEEPTGNLLPPDPICIDPRQNLSDQQAELVARAGDAAAGLQGGAADDPAQQALGGQNEDRQAAERKAEANQADAPPGETLIEAMPDYRNNPLPEYPLIARQRHWQGVVWLLVDVSAKGLVDDIDLEQSCGYRVLDKAASRAVQRWEFTPAKRAGLPVASQVRIPVRFSLEGS